MTDSVLVLGRMFPPDTEGEVVSLTRGGMISSAASAHLEKIISGLDAEFGEKNVRILNVPPISSFPMRYKRLFIKKRVWSLAKTSDTGAVPRGTSIDFFNLTVLKSISIQRRLDSCALEAVRKGGIRYVVAYTANEIFLKTCVKIKKRFPECHICVVVPDLPEFTDLDKTGLKGLLYKPIIRRRVRRTNALMETADSFVFLTEQMADYFPVKRPYIVCEGIASDTEAASEKKRVGEDDIITAAYTGSFTKRYGIMELMDAVGRIRSKNVRFVIAGSGEAYDEVQKRAKEDERIIFRGTVTHDEALAIQKSADILINPRMNNEEFTKYSFPSKIMEYMSAGKPVICFRLDGIPSEYDEYLTYFESTDTMHTALEELISRGRECLADMGARGAEFVRAEKNSAQFGKRLRALMEKKSILICSDDLCIGGTTTSLLSLLGMIDTNRYAVSLITPNGAGELIDRVPRYVSVLGAPTERSRVKRGIAYLLRGYLLLRFLYKRFWGKRYPKGAFQLMSGIACTAVSARVRRRFDAVIGYMEGFADHYAVKRTSGARKLLYVHVNYNDSGLDPRLDKRIFSRADGIAAVSADGADALRTLFPECAHKITVVQNPISPALIRSLADESIPEPDYAEKGCFNIVTAARLENAHKAIDRAVMTMARIRKMTDKNVRWYVFGDGGDRESIERLIRENGVEDCFFLMGSRQNVYPYIKRADIFVLTSRYEGKPMCVEEAQILGCVPVVTEYGSAKEQIRNGIDGIICPNSDGAELAEAIVGIMDDLPLLGLMRKRLSERGYECGAESFYRFLGI